MPLPCLPGCKDPKGTMDPPWLLPSGSPEGTPSPRLDPGRRHGHHPLGPAPLAPIPQHRLTHGVPGSCAPSTVTPSLAPGPSCPWEPASSTGSSRDQHRRRPVCANCLPDPRPECPRPRLSQQRLHTRAHALLGLPALLPLLCLPLLSTLPPALSTSPPSLLLSSLLHSLGAREPPRPSLLVQTPF